MTDCLAVILGKGLSIVAVKVSWDKALWVSRVMLGWWSENGRLLSSHWVRDCMGVVQVLDMPLWVNNAFHFWWHRGRLHICCSGLPGNCALWVNCFTWQMVLKWLFVIDTGEDSAWSLFRSARRQNSLSKKSLLRRLSWNSCSSVHLHCSVLPGDRAS